MHNKIFIVSPYNIIRDNDEIYLIACDEKSVDSERRLLSHFKISQISDVKILDKFLSSFGINSKYGLILKRARNEIMDFQAVVEIAENAGLYQ